MSSNHWLADPSVQGIHQAREQHAMVLRLLWCSGPGHPGIDHHPVDVAAYRAAGIATAADFDASHPQCVLPLELLLSFVRLAELCRPTREDAPSGRPGRTVRWAGPSRPASRAVLCRSAGRAERSSRPRWDEHNEYVIITGNIEYTNER